MHWRREPRPGAYSPPSCPAGVVPPIWLCGSQRSFTILHTRLPTLTSRMPTNTRYVERGSAPSATRLQNARISGERSGPGPSLQASAHWTARSASISDLFESSDIRDCFLLIHPDQATNIRNPACAETRFHVSRASRRSLGIPGSPECLRWAERYISLCRLGHPPHAIPLMQFQEDADYVSLIVRN